MFSNRGKLLFRDCLQSRNVIKKFFATQNASTAVASDEFDCAIPLSKIPGPSKLKLIYDFSAGAKKHLQLYEMLESYRQTYGGIYRIPGILGQPDTVTICDVNNFEHVFRNDGPWPERRGLDIMEYYRRKRRPDIFKNGGLGIEQGAKWGEFRKAVNPVMMQPKIVKLYVSQIDEIAEEFIARIKRIRDPKSLELPVDFEEELNDWSLEAITIIALDTRLNLLGNIGKSPESKRFTDAVKQVFPLLTRFLVRPPIWKLYPTAEFKEFMNVLDVITDTSRSYVDAAKKRIESKQNGNGNNKSSIGHEESVLEKLIKVDPEVATVMVIDMIMAGVDTTSSAFISTLYNLSVNNEKQEILRQEILEILPRKDSKLTSDKMKHMPYLRACIKEALRIMPVVSGNSRDTTRDIVIGSYQIPQGTRILMHPPIPQSNEAIFKNAKIFMPERWLKSNDPRACPEAKATHAFAFLPFGFGPRMCIGRRFAELEIEVLLSRIIRNFRVEWHKPNLKFKSAAVNTPAAPLQFKLIDLNE